jgi:hypothetical protein
MDNFVNDLTKGVHLTIFKLITLFGEFFRDDEDFFAWTLNKLRLYEGTNPTDCLISHGLFAGQPLCCLLDRALDM